MAKLVEIKPKLRRRLHLPPAEGQDERAQHRAFYRKKGFERVAYVSQSAHSRALRRSVLETESWSGFEFARESRCVVTLTIAGPSVHHRPPVYVDRPCAFATRHDHMDTCVSSLDLFMVSSGSFFLKFKFV